MTDKLQDHKEEKGTDPKRRDDKLQVDDNKKEKQMNDILSEEANTKDPQRTDEMALMHPATTSLLGATNPQNKRAADELEKQLKRIRVHPRVTTQPKGRLMIKGEGWASSDGTDTNGGKWTPCPEKIIRKPGSMIENNKQTKTQSGNKNKEHNRMETIHGIETLQKGKDSERPASKLESQDSNTWVTHKMKREENEDQMDSEENQEEEAERYDGKEDKEDGIHDTWELVPLGEKKKMKTRKKEDDEQIGKPEEVTVNPPELETRKERRQVVAEYSARPDHVEAEPEKEASMGGLDDWILIETPRLETYNKEAGTTQMKPRDMKAERKTY